MDVMVVAGEASGDAHAAGLVAALKAKRPALRFWGMGGERLRAQGVELVRDAKEINVMGLVEVLPKLPRILGVLKALTELARSRRPAVALLVDIPDFNLRLARRLRKLGIRTVSYVAPTVWAWRAGRAKLLARDFEKVLCILPFEETFLRERGVNAVYVGSPVPEQLPAPAPPQTFRAALGLDLQRPTLTLLPGSRPSEVARLLPTLVEVARAQTALRPQLQVVVPLAPGVKDSDVAPAFAAAGVAVTLVQGRSAEAVGASDVAVVKSGTSTLEAALMQRPFVAFYKVAATTYWIGKAMVRIPFFTLPNLLMGREIVPELLQGDATAARIGEKLNSLWEGPAREACLADLKSLRSVLGDQPASERGADEVLAVIDAPVG